MAMVSQASALAQARPLTTEAVLATEVVFFNSAKQWMLLFLSQTFSSPCLQKCRPLFAKRKTPFLHLRKSLHKSFNLEGWPVSHL